MLERVVVFGWLAIVIFMVVRVILALNDRAKEDEKKAHAEDSEQKNRIQRIRDHQLNVGRQVYNIISDWKEHFSGLLLQKMVVPDKFSIIIGRQLKVGTDVSLQLDFDFVDKFGKNCEGHIFYAPYGADMYFNVPNHIDVREQKWLSDLVWNRLERDFAPELSKTI